MGWRAKITDSGILPQEPIDGAAVPSINAHHQTKAGPPNGGQGMEAAMIEALMQRVNDDPLLVRRGRFLTTTFLLEVGATVWLIAIHEGRIVSVTPGPFVMPSSAFALRAPAEEWAKFWSERPPPGSNDLMALIKRRALRAEGDLQVFMAHLRYFKEALAKLRPQQPSAASLAAVLP
jgi:hypothetical protein